LKWARDTGYDLTHQANLDDDFDEISAGDSVEDDEFVEPVGTTGIEFDDDDVAAYREDDNAVRVDDAADGAARNVVQQNNKPAVQAGDLEVGRATRSGRVYNRGPTPQPVDVLNPRVQAEMRRLGTTFYNPIPETILHQDQPNAPLGREVDENAVVDVAQENGLSAMDHLFGDFAFYVRENDLDEMVLKTRDGNDTNRIRDDLKKMHILDALDMLVENKINIPISQRDEILREIVLELKANLPKSYKEAWDHPDPKMRMRWRKAFGKEKDSMMKRKVWKVIKKAMMPKGRRCVKSKWVFDIKRNGTFKVRLVACGYTQIPGVDFTDSFALCTSDIGC